MSLPNIGRRFQLFGVVQGVGLRPWLYRRAVALGLSGSVHNSAHSVVLEVFGAEKAVDSLEVELRSPLPLKAQLSRLEVRALDAFPSTTSFTIEGEVCVGSAPYVGISPDVATCAACTAELFSSDNRRYRYPFIACAECGPRFSMATALPYERHHTSMADFPLCPACQREYTEPDNRRFHAQAIACPDCGPRWNWQGPGQSSDVLEAAARVLETGGIVAFKGLGGFHLVCDARNAAAVVELRRRKLREARPFAVMVQDAAEAQSLGVLGEVALQLLQSPAHPVVLVRARGGLAPEVSGRSNRIGLFLPYTPAHALLLHRLKRPLVMTSGNRSREPMATDNEKAGRHLAAVADGLVTHNRTISHRLDDSVVQVACGQPMVLRRGRGYVPTPLKSPVHFAQPVLAVGGHLKNAFCLGVGDFVTLSAHVGDLDDWTTFQDFESAISSWEALLGVTPQVVAHDAHPHYQSTLYAGERPVVRLVAVQHHHAHVAAVMAEHGVDEPVWAVAFDGTGLGLDGTSWGGEFFLATYAQCQRVATTRPIRLAGAERAVEQPWRVAMAVLDDAFEGQASIASLALFSQLDAQRVAQVRRLLHQQLGVVAHGVGRLFDAAAALILARPQAAYEAELPMLLEETADGEAAPWPFVWDDSGALPQLDLRPMWRALHQGLLSGTPVGQLAARFHATLGAATAIQLQSLLLRERRPVVLSGGCMANARLLEEIVSRLPGERVYWPQAVPPGDGGLALGQAVVAAVLGR